MGDKPNTTTYRRPSVSIGMGLDGADYSYLTKKTEGDGGFFITFNVPFKRTDIFAELLNDNGQLGGDGFDSGVTQTVVKPGREAGKLVSGAFRARVCFFPGSSSPQQARGLRRRRLAVFFVSRRARPTTES